MKLTNNSNEGGALGCFALIKPAHFGGDPRIALIGSASVLFASHKEDKNPVKIFSPDYSSCCSGGAHIASTIGTYDDYFSVSTESVYATIRRPLGNHDYVGEGYPSDLALALVEPGISYSNDIPGIGAIAGDRTLSKADIQMLPVPAALTIPFPSVPPPPDMLVRYFSPVTQRVHYGVVVNLEYGQTAMTGPLFGRPVPTTYYPKQTCPNGENPALDRGETYFSVADKPLINQLLVLPVPDPNPTGTSSPPLPPLQWWAPGDSGSVVVDSNRNIIGFLATGIAYDPSEWFMPHEKGPPWMQAITTNLDYSKGLGIGVVTPYPEIYGVSVQSFVRPDGSALDGIAPAHGDLVAVPGDAEEQALDRGREGAAAQLRESRVGRLILAKLRQHGSEVRKLVARDRRAQATWHRLQGSAFVQHIARNLRNPRHRIPLSINGVTREQLIVEMADVLAAGSPALQRDIARYRELVITYAPRIDTLEHIGEFVVTAWRDWTSA
jgi:hypothetical protein